MGTATIGYSFAPLISRLGGMLSQELSGPAKAGTANCSISLSASQTIGSIFPTKEDIKMTETDTLYSSLGEAERYAKDLEGKLALVIDENERLREALKPFAEAHRIMELMPHVERYNFTCAQLLQARLALEPAT